MKKYKINLQVTGYVEFEEAQTEQPSLFDEKKEEKISEAQYWYLANNTKIPDEIINILSSKLAHELIGKLKQKERAVKLQEVPKIDNLYIDEAPEIAPVLREKLVQTIKKMCKEPLCGKQVLAKGLCSMHYQEKRSARLRGSIK